MKGDTRPPVTGIGSPPAANACGRSVNPGGL
jgi:hypothetical protein